VSPVSVSPGFMQAAFEDIRVRQHAPAAQYTPAEGTYLAWIDFAPLGLSAAARFFREEARVSLSGGEAFGAPTSAVRLSFATSRAFLGEILKRMARALARGSHR
jgi:cysteine-S-conjugate beta-lyase